MNLGKAVGQEEKDRATVLAGCPMSRDVRDMRISDSMFEWTIASVSALVHVETDEEQTGEAIQDNIPPKTIGLIGATHDPVARLENFPHSV